MTDSQRPSSQRPIEPDRAPSFYAKRSVDLKGWVAIVITLLGGAAGSLISFERGLARADVLEEKVIQLESKAEKSDIETRNLRDRLIALEHTCKRIK